MCLPLLNPKQTKLYPLRDAYQLFFSVSSVFILGEMCVLSFSLVCFTFSMLIGIDCGLEQRYRVGSLKTVLNYKLQGHQIKTVKGTTLVSCGQSCLEDLRRASTNFGVLQDKKPVCELNDIGISLLSKRELHRAEGFVLIFTPYSEVLPYKPADMEVFTNQLTRLQANIALVFLIPAVSSGTKPR